MNDPGVLSNGLHRRKQEGQKERDDGNDGQQLNDGETRSHTGLSWPLVVAKGYRRALHATTPSMLWGAVGENVCHRAGLVAATQIGCICGMVRDRVAESIRNVDKPRGNRVGRD